MGSPPDAIHGHLAAVLKASKTTIASHSQKGASRVFECCGPQDLTFSVWLSPAGEAGGAFERGEGFLLGYQGEPPATVLAALRGLAARLRALERATSTSGWFTAQNMPDESSGPSLIYGTSRVEIRVTLRCNERCLFCNSSQSAENLVGSEAEAMDLLVQARKAGAEMVVLTGGEPLLMPWLPAVAQAARKMGYERVTLQTNGVLLAQPEIWERLQGVKPDEVLISVHGPNDQVVTEVSGVAGLLEAKKKAIVTSVEAGYRIVVSYVLCRQNMAHAAATMEMLAALSAPPYMVALSVVAPSGAAVAEGRRVIPSMTEAAPYLLAALQRADELGLRPVLVEYCVMPTCITPKLRRFCEPFDPRYPLGVPPDKRKLPVCLECDWTHRCSGIFAGYLDLYGDEEFTSVPPSHRKVP